MLCIEVTQNYVWLWQLIDKCLNSPLTNVEARAYIYIANCYESVQVHLYGYCRQI